MKKNKVQAAITAYVTTETRNKFNQMCAEQGTNASSVVRQFIMQTVRETTKNDN